MVVTSRVVSSDDALTILALASAGRAVAASTAPIASDPSEPTTTNRRGRRL